MNIIIKQMPAFKKAYKKLHSNEKIVIDEAIKTIIKTPEIGEEKKGDLRGVFVYKVKFKIKEFLLAYEWTDNERLLLALGLHENFYKGLKKNIYSSAFKNY